MPTLAFATLKRALPFLAIAAFLVATPAARAEEWTKTYSISGRPQVRVRTNDGAVRVYTTDTKQIELRVEYHGYELNKSLRIDSRQDGDRVELDARLTNHWCVFCININRTLRIEVHMPRSADLNVDTGDGSVESQSIEGNLDIHTGDGHITVRGSKGNIRLRTGDGAIDAQDLDGTVEATTGDGHIRMDGRFEVLNLKTGDGRIDARINSGSKMTSSWSIRTGDGSVDVSLPEGFQADLDALTHDGRINVGFPITVEGGGINKSHIQGKLNGGGQTFTVHTGDGSIHLRRA
jgi:DUF4097 and DUF4098 domain-containing protein YvlB